MISSRVSNISESASVKLAGEITLLRSKGERIIGLHIGEPDFLPEKNIATAISQAMREGKVRYSLVAGEIALREKIIKVENNISPTSIDIDNVVISNGSKQSLYNIFQTICDPGDEVIILVPYWVSFPESVKLSGAIPKLLKLDENLQPDIELIEKEISPRTKAIIINNPSNPTGVIYRKDILIQIGHLAKKHNFFVVADEAYDGLVYEKGKYSSFSHLNPSFFSHTITTKTFSKTYAMTGHRIGYTIAPKEITKALVKLQGHLTGNNCTFVQYGAIEALNISASKLESMCEEFKNRRDYCYHEISKVLPCIKPSGAFYVFPNVEEILIPGESTRELCEKILEETKVAVLPGDAFGSPGFIRIAFTVSQQELQEGIQLLTNFFNKRKSR